MHTHGHKRTRRTLIHDGRGTRFPDELIPHDAARRLLLRLGVQIVAGDEQLIAEAQAAETERAAAAALERARLKQTRAERRRQAADERTADIPYRRRRAVGE
jgi:hypothetical protein